MTNVVVWRLHHPNGQSARCTLVSDVGGAWRLQRWLNGFVAGGEEFRKRDEAFSRAIELRKGFEARGFRED